MVTPKKITQVTIHYVSGRERKLTLRGEIYNGYVWSIVFQEAADRGAALRIPESVRISSDTDIVIYFAQVEDVEVVTRDAVQG
jgi:hypothetical protein